MKTMTRSVIFSFAAILYIVLSPWRSALAVLPPPAPDGGYLNGNTAEGNDALFSLEDGFHNTAIGLAALYRTTNGSYNTAIGSGALQFNTTGSYNTAIGQDALSGIDGPGSTGFANTATGWGSLFNNETGNNNTATGFSALGNNDGHNNTATGFRALSRNVFGNNNSAFGNFSLFANTTGGFNTAMGDSALGNNDTGSYNIALGANAGINLTIGSYNISIGNNGVVGESATIRIGDQNQTATYIAGIYGTSADSTFVPVVINAAGQLGVGEDAGVPKGTIITVAPGSPVPNGYTFLGTQTDAIRFRNAQGDQVKIKGAKLYQKN